MDMSATDYAISKAKELSPRGKRYLAAALNAYVSGGTLDVFDDMVHFGEIAAVADGLKGWEVRELLAELRRS